MHRNGSYFPIFQPWISSSFWTVPKANHAKPRIVQNRWKYYNQDNTQNGSPSTVQHISHPTKPSICVMAPVRFIQPPLLKDTLSHPRKTLWCNTWLIRFNPAVSWFWVYVWSEGRARLIWGGMCLMIMSRARDVFNADSIRRKLMSWDAGMFPYLGTKRLIYNILSNTWVKLPRVQLGDYTLYHEFKNPCIYPAATFRWAGSKTAAAYCCSSSLFRFFYWSAVVTVHHNE